MALKIDANFQEKLTLRTKSDMRNLVNFNLNSSKSKNLHFYGLLLSKYIMFEPKKSTEELCVITLKNDAIFEE